MNWQIKLHPLDVIPLFERDKVWRLYLFLPIKALITISTPSSPILFPLRTNSLIALLRLRHSSIALIPWSPTSFFLILNTSRYFLSLSDYPRATAPSEKIPFIASESSVMYFLLTKTLLTELAPPGPMKFWESISSLRVLWFYIDFEIAIQPSLIILLFVRSKTNKFLLFSRLFANSFAPSSRIKQSLKWRFVSVSLSLIPYAKIFAPSTPITFPSSNSLVKNFLFCNIFESDGIHYSVMHMFWRVITLKVSLSINPFEMAVTPSSLKGLLLRLILLNLYLLDKMAPIS